MTMEMLLNKLNDLAKKAKLGTLTIEEVIIRDELRAMYLTLIRQAFRNQIERVKVVDEEGNDLTPDKLKTIQLEKGIHNRERDLPTMMAAFLAEIPED